MNKIDSTLFEIEEIYEIELLSGLHNMCDIMVEEDESFCLADGTISHNSAMGQILNVRDPMRVGGYPLKGKIPNVMGMKPIDIMKNVEIGELMSILDLTFNEVALSLVYGTIGVMTDADVDGGQIACLLALLFHHWPELFTQRRIALVQTPLIRATKKGKKAEIFYTLKEWKAAGLEGYQVEYFKGLGSLPEALYAEAVNNPRLVYLTLGDDPLAALSLAFGNDPDARKEWLSTTAAAGE